ncbi:MAG: SDR family NAD(P)-dependent oxidoreductase [Polyangiaceae bacterium]|nr:SDR family NAD(P)-dependent oxidoreductase [Polyangiaceae bacterium]
MKVFVTGASGFLGSHVAEQLSAEGHSVVALVRRSSNTKFLSTLKNVELAYGAVEDAASVRAAVKGADAVVHSAGLVKARNEQEFHRVNVEGTRNVLEAAAEECSGPRRFVFVSSLAAVGPSIDGKPVGTEAEGKPVTAYGRSKLAAERLVLEAKEKLPVVVLRPPMIYGPRDPDLRLRRGERVHSGGGDRRAERPGLFYRRRAGLRVEGDARRYRAGARVDGARAGVGAVFAAARGGGGERGPLEDHGQGGDADARQDQRAQRPALGLRFVGDAARFGLGAEG